MLRIQLAALAATALAAPGGLAAAGCGGSSKTAASTAAASSTTPRTTTRADVIPPPTTDTIKLASGLPLTRSEWIARGNVICARTKTKLSAIGVVSTREYVRTFPQIAIYDHVEAHELSRLVPPRSKAHDWARIVNDLQLVGDSVSTIAAYLQAKNESAASSLFQTTERLRARLHTIVGREGFKECLRM